MYAIRSYYEAFTLPVLRHPQAGGHLADLGHGGAGDKLAQLLSQGLQLVQAGMGCQQDEFLAAPTGDAVDGAQPPTAEGNQL